MQFQSKKLLPPFSSSDFEHPARGAMLGHGKVRSRSKGRGEKNVNEARCTSCRSGRSRTGGWVAPDLAGRAPASDLSVFTLMQAFRMVSLHVRMYQHSAIQSSRPNSKFEYLAHWQGIQYIQPIAYIIRFIRQGNGGLLMMIIRRDCQHWYGFVDVQLQPDFAKFPPDKRTRR